MIALRPRALVHRGVLTAEALLIDVSLVGERAARARVLQLWRNGDTVHSLAGGLLLRFSSPRTLDAQRSPGTLLVRSGSLLTAAPLTAKERQAFEGTPNGVVLVRDGIAKCQAIPTATVDMSEWLDVSAFSVVEVRSLGAPPAPPVEIAEKKVIDVRATLAPHLGPVPKEQLEVLAAMRGEKKAASAKRGGPGILDGIATMFAALFAGATFTSTVAANYVPWLNRLADFIDRLFPPTAQGSGPALPPRGASSKPLVPPAPPKPSKVAEMLRRLNAWASRQVAKSKLARLFAQRHAEYLAKLFEMFDENNLDEALRHAIPLNGLPGELPDSPLLGLPSRRSSLDFTSGRSFGSGAGIVLETSLFARLQQKYRNAFEKLKQAGRMRDAAFVLLELLNQPYEAVSFLESHNEFKLAAEIAESRELQPGLIVRLWILAGDPSRAVAIARKTGSFQDAISRLEAAHKPQADSLRVAWADQLATAGNFAAAVEAIWPLESFRNVANEWVDRGIEQGGASGARLLLRKLAFDASAFPFVRDRVLSLLDDTDTVTLPTRAVVATELRTWLRAGTLPASQRAFETLVRPVVRSQLRDLRDRSAAPGLIKALADETPDRTLSQDLPQLPREGTGAQGAWSHRLFTAEDVGRTPIHDAALLPDGRLLLALGEAGTQMLSRDGRVVARFDRPAYHLVPSDHGDRALVLAPRDPGTVSVSKLDLLNRTSAHWVDAKLFRWANSFDGDHWFAASYDTVFAIDATHPEFRAIWKVTVEKSPYLATSPQVVRRSSSSLALLMSRVVTEESISTPAPQIWRYELPSLTLRDRYDVDVPQRLPNSDVIVSPNYSPRSVSASGLYAAALRGVVKASLQAIVVKPDMRTSVQTQTALSFPPAPASDIWNEQVWESVLDVHVTDKHLVLVHDLGISLFATNPFRGLFRWLFLGPKTERRVRLTDTHLIVCDHSGRVIVFDLQTGHFVRDLRL